MKIKNFWKTDVTVSLLKGEALIAGTTINYSPGCSLQVRHNATHKPSPGFPLPSGSPSSFGNSIELASPANGGGQNMNIN